MNNSVAFEPFPNHPLGARDRWPATGPIYGVPERNAAPAQGRTIWERLVSGPRDTANPAISGATHSPIWY